MHAMHCVLIPMYCRSAKVCKMPHFACSMTVSPQVKVHKKDEANNDMNNSQIPLAATESSQIAEKRVGFRAETSLHRLRIDVPCLCGNARITFTQPDPHFVQRVVSQFHFSAGRWNTATGRQQTK